MIAVFFCFERLTMNNKIRQWRKTREMTLKDLQASSKIDISYLSLIERGRLLPTARQKFDICRALKTSESVLFNE